MSASQRCAAFSPFGLTQRTKCVCDAVTRRSRSSRSAANANTTPRNLEPPRRAPCGEAAARGAKSAAQSGSLEARSSTFKYVSKPVSQWYTKPVSQDVLRERILVLGKEALRRVGDRARVVRHAEARVRRHAEVARGGPGEAWVVLVLLEELECEGGVTALREDALLVEQREEAW
eukprot:scaffold93051_cov69-Phaeocystis_antarctica.AAC.2